MRILTLIVVSSVATGLLCAQPQSQKYEFIEVTRFEVQQGLEVPAVYLDALDEDLAEQLRRTQRFREVLRTGTSPADPSAAVVRLVGTLKEFRPGSRAKRYLIGPGVGKTKLQAHIRLLDRATGEVLLEQDVDGKVIFGLFGGDSLGAARGLAKEVAKVTKKRFS